MRIYSVAGKQGTAWYLDYNLNGKRVRKRIGRSREMAEAALAKVRGQLERRRIERVVSRSAHAVTILNRPVVILPIEEYQALLAKAGRRADSRLARFLSKPLNPSKR